MAAKNAPSPPDSEVLQSAIPLHLPPILEMLTEQELLSQVPRAAPKDIYWDDVKIGDRAAVRITVSWKWILLFAMISGDYNPLHVDKQFAATVGKQTFGGKNIAHGALSNAFLSGVNGYRLLGSGIYLHRKLEAQYLRAVVAGDEILAVSEIVEKFSENVKGKDRYFLKISNRIYYIKGDTLELAVDTPSIAGVLRKSRPT